MKKKAISLILIILMFSCGTVFANENITNDIRAEKINSTIELNEISDESLQDDSSEVNATSGGIRNITFSDGYNGYCINMTKHYAEKGHTFTPKDTSHAMNNKYNTPIGNYLKILFVEFYDFATGNSDDVSEVIWDFSDRYYLDSTNEITQAILKLAENGRTIPDHGETKKINEHTQATFDFQVFDSSSNDIQNYFGYKITLNEIKNNTSNKTVNKTETNSTDSLKTNSSNTNSSKNESIEDNTLQKNKNTSEQLNSTSSQKTNEKSSLNSIVNSTGNPILLLLLISVIFAFNGIYKKR